MVASLTCDSKRSVNEKPRIGIATHRNETLPQIAGRFVIFMAGGIGRTRSKIYDLHHEGCKVSFARGFLASPDQQESRTAPPGMFHTGFQYTSVDSMATRVTPQARSQSLIAATRSRRSQNGAFPSHFPFGLGPQHASRNALPVYVQSATARVKNFHPSPPGRAERDAGEFENLIRVFSARAETTIRCASLRPGHTRMRAICCARVTRPLSPPWPATTIRHSSLFSFFVAVLKARLFVS
jgi:hypothetical protein